MVARKPKRFLANELPRPSGRAERDNEYDKRTGFGCIVAACASDCSGARDNFNLLWSWLAARLRGLPRINPIVHEPPRGEAHRRAVEFRAEPGAVGLHGSVRLARFRLRALDLRYAPLAYRYAKHSAQRHRNGHDGLAFPGGIRWWHRNDRIKSHAPTSQECGQGIEDLRNHSFITAVLELVQQFARWRARGVEHRVAESIVPDHSTARRVNIQSVAIAPRTAELMRIDLDRHRLRL